VFFCSGIFGYVNYLVEKDRKFIIDTLINGMWRCFALLARPYSPAQLPLDAPLSPATFNRDIAGLRYEDDGDALFRAAGPRFESYGC